MGFDCISSWSLLIFLFCLKSVKSNNLIILNGRFAFGKDKEIGDYTFKTVSVIDYSIATTEALKYILDFEIKALDCMYSDGHAILSTTLEFEAI